MMTIQVNDPVLQRLMQEVEAVRLDARSLTQGLTAEQLRWQPAPGKWSIAQCLDHVAKTIRLYPADVERMIAESRTRAARGAKPYRHTRRGNWLIRTLEPPYRMRVRTMKSVEPAAELDVTGVLADFDVAHQQLEQMIAAADGVPLDQARITSPFSKLMTMTLRQVLEVNVVHSRRHLWQARQVKQQPGFPA